MRFLDLMDGKAIGLGLLAYAVLSGLALLVVGFDPSDTELQLVIWPAAAVGLAVTTVAVLRGGSDADK